MTVAVPATADPSAFDFVAIAAHEGVYRYLRDAVICHDPASGGETGCTAGGPQRPKVFVADGTHAGYPRGCRKLAFVYCRQTGMPLPEKGFDGRRAWGANDDPAALKPFGPGWEAWGGNWNSQATPRVNSPARQGRHRAPWQVHCTTRWSLAECERASASQAGGEGCAAWFGPFTAATVCDPAALREALRTGTLGAAGAVRITADGAASASVPGLAQAVGDVLAPGQSLRVDGTATGPSALLVRAQDAGGIVHARYDDLGLADGGVVTVTAIAERAGVALRAVDETGRVLRAAEQTRELTRRPARPSRVQARRRGGRIRVTFTARTGQVAIQPQRRRVGGALSATTYTVRPGRRGTVSVPASRRARYVSVVALGPAGVPSRPLVVRMRG